MKKAKRLLLLVVSLVLAMCMTVSLIACGGKGSGTPSVSITLDKTTLPLEVGGDVGTITATVTGSEEKVTWQLSAAGVVSISSNGNTVTVTPIAEGEVNVTAKIGSVTKSCAVTVTEPEAPTPVITLSPTALTFTEGDDPQTVTASIANGTGKVTWSVEPATGVVTLSGTDTNTISVTPVGAGDATITATFAGAQAKTVSVHVDERPAPVITLTPTTLVLEYDSSISEPSDQESKTVTATLENATGNVEWSIGVNGGSVIHLSVDGNVATVQPLQTGNTTLTASFDGATDKTITVMVINKGDVALVVEPANLSLTEEDTTATLTAQVVNGDATEVEWASDNTDVVTVDPTGETVTVTVVGPGSTTITASLEGATPEQIPIPVDVAEITIELDEDELELTAGGHTELTATSNTGKTINWASSDPEKVTVTPTGTSVTVTAVAATTDPVTITAKVGDDGATATCSVTVYDPLEISLDKESLTLTVAGADDESDTLTAIVTGGKGDVTAADVTWESSDDDVAKVTPGSGATVTVTAAGAGTCTITAHLTGADDVTCSVTVNPEVVPDPVITIDPTSLNLTEGGATGTITASLTNATGTVTFASDNTSVVTVTQEGNTATVTPVGQGTTTISVSFEGAETVTCAVTVAEASNGTDLVFSGISRFGGANNDANAEMQVNYDINADKLEMGADKTFDTIYINGTVHSNVEWIDEGTPGGASHQAHLYLRDYTTQYDTNYVITLKKGDVVVASGSFLIETPKSISVSSETAGALVGSTLTLDPEGSATLVVTITGNFPNGSTYLWEPTLGGEYIEIEQGTGENAHKATITAKAYTGVDNLSAAVKVTYGLGGTTLDKTIYVTINGSGGGGDDPYASITLVFGAVEIYAPQFGNFDLLKKDEPEDISYVELKDTYTSYKIMVKGTTNDLAGAHKNMFELGVSGDYRIQLQNTSEWQSGTTYEIEFYDSADTLIAVATVEIP